MSRKTCDVADVKAGDVTQGIAEMIVSVFNNIDADNEIVMPGFFTESIERRRTPDGRPRVKGVWGHDWLTPVAKTLEARELLPNDPLLPPHLAALGGLYVKGHFNLDTQRGREAFSDLTFGTVDEFSFGFNRKEYAIDNETGIVRLLKGDWHEWALVLVGSNDQTALISAKDAGNTYADQGETVLAAVDAYLDRTKALAALRAKANRAVSRANWERLVTQRDRLREVDGGLTAFLDEHDPDHADDPEKAARIREARKEQLRYLTNRARQMATLGV